MTMLFQDLPLVSGEEGLGIFDMDKLSVGSRDDGFEPAFNRSF